MINLFYRTILNNANQFKKDDAVVFITLEDDIWKILRRFISIFGNFDANLVRKTWIRTSQLLKDNKSNAKIQKKVFDLVSELLTHSVRKVTNNKVNCVLKHCSENSFSPADAAKFIDTLKMQGYNVKLVAIDYIDVMTPTSKSFGGDEYVSQGQIVQEMRMLARNYSLPIITITQNVRSSENYDQAMSNQLIGDSIKKIRYSDFVYMIRQRFDLDLLSEQVKQDVIDPNSNESFNLSLVDVSSPEFRNLIPFEIKITKAKEGKKDVSKYHLFNGGNLRIYNTLNEFFADLPEFKKINKNLGDTINLLNTVLVQTPEMDDSTDLLI